MSDKAPTHDVEEDCASNREEGTDSLVRTYRKATPGQSVDEWVKNPLCQQCSQKLSPKEFARDDRICLACVRVNRGRVWDPVNESSVKSFREFMREQDQITVNPKTKNDPVAAIAPPGMEDWIRKNKSAYTKKHGAERAEQLLYADAWDTFNKSRSTMSESATQPVAGKTYQFKHEVVYVWGVYTLTRPTSGSTYTDVVYSTKPVAGLKPNMNRTSLINKLKASGVYWNTLDLDEFLTR